MVRLEVISGDDAGLVVERDVDVLRIGRAADSHVPLTAHHVSGTHASVVFCAEGHVVRLSRRGKDGLRITVPDARTGKDLLEALGLGPPPAS